VIGADVDRVRSRFGALPYRLSLLACAVSRCRFRFLTDRRRRPENARLLPPYTTGSVRIRSNLDIKLGRAIVEGGNGELQIEGARCGAGTRQEASASASRASPHFVGASIVRA
jgi:hypothetical protein